MLITMLLMIILIMLQCALYYPFWHDGLKMDIKLKKRNKPDARVNYTNV